MRRSKRLTFVLFTGLAMLQTGCSDGAVADAGASVTDLGVSLAKRRRPRLPTDTVVPAPAPVPPVVVPPVVVPPVVVPPVVVPPVVPPALPPLPGGDAYFPFTGSPASPVPFNEPGWDVQLYSRDIETWYNPEAMDAHHGADCAGYPATHRVTSYTDMVFRCRDHIMTSIKATGYGAVVLTPDRMASWASGEAVIRFDVTTLQTSPRDWLNIFVSPYESHLQLPTTYDAPGLNGPPRDGIYFELSSNGNYCPRFVQNFNVTKLACNEEWKPMSEKVVASATRRNTVEIRLSSNRVKLWMPNDNIVFYDGALPGTLPFTEGVVQFGHYSYNPLKECTLPAGCAPNTWHWDEIHIAPSIPFSIIRADRRFVDGTGGTVTLSSPAPSGAKFGFFAAGVEPDISFDGGATWQAPVAQASNKTSEPERQYWTPIPAGTTRVMLRQGRNITWWTQYNTWMARDFSVWSR